MRLSIRHQSDYEFQTPAKGIVQILRLTPRSHDGQYVSHWRIELSHDARLRMTEDAFGNITHTYHVEGPVSHLSVVAEGEVETSDTHGVVLGGREKLPVALFLRDTPLTRADSDISVFARAAIESVEDPENRLSVLHRLNGMVYSAISFDTNPTDAATTAVDSFRMKKGVCQDLAHIFIAGARTLGIPARYVGGYFYRTDGIIEQEAGHAWAEAYVPDLGWVGFDPAHGISDTERHVRVAIGHDYLGASPIRGSRYGGAGEKMTVRVSVDTVA